MAAIAGGEGQPSAGALGCSKDVFGGCVLDVPALKYRLNFLSSRRAKAAQKALIESRGGPEEVMRNLITTKNCTPVPTEVEAKL